MGQGLTWQNMLERQVEEGQDMPGLIREQGSLPKEVGLEQMVDLLLALRSGLQHNSLALLDDVEQTARITLHAYPQA